MREIYALHLEKQSLIQLARELASRGWVTKQWTTRKGQPAGGKPYDKNNLFKLITNALYVGKVRYKDELHAGEHRGIVDLDVWEKAQRMLRVNGRTGGSYTRNMYGALLKGLLYCRPCGLVMGHTFTAGQGNRRYRYYTCYGASKRGWDLCPSKSVPAEQIEQFVVDQIRAMGSDPAIRSLVLDQVRADGEEQATALEGEAAIVRREVGQLHTEIKVAAKTAGQDGDAAARLVPSAIASSRTTNRPVCAVVGVTPRRAIRDWNVAALSVGVMIGPVMASRNGSQRLAGPEAEIEPSRTDPAGRLGRSAHDASGPGA